jgi:hypothetical protein
LALSQTQYPETASVGVSFVGSMAQVASGGGWQTTFTLINTGTSAAQVQLSFFDNNGNALSLPLTFVQSGAITTASTINQTIAGGATLVVVTQGTDAGASVVGSAQLSTTGNVSGFAIFRYNPTGQEAVVPLETRNATAYVLAFDNTGGLGTGVAIANLAAQPAHIPVVIRDDTGTQIGTETISLPAQCHTSFMLTGNYAITNGKRGSIEFDTPLSGNISALGLRANGSALTTLPLLADVTASGGSMAQVASGGGWQTTFTLVNTGSSSAQAQLSFFDDNGNALSLPLTFVQSGTANASGRMARDGGGTIHTERR